MLCKMCGEDKKLIKSHIIPKSFYKPLMKDRKIPLLVTDKKGQYSSKLRIGIYDSSIVCKECERIFTQWDEYANKFFNQRLLSQNFIIQSGKRIAYNFGIADYKKLKLFFLSVLWRASVSNERMFTRVSLGKYEERIKELMLSNLEIDCNNFSIIIYKFTNMNINGFLDPDKTKFNNVNYYRIYLGEYMAVIKVSSLIDFKPFKDYSIKEDKDVICIFRDFQNSKEYITMKKVSRKSLINAKS